jgi:transposase InsO family protein
MYLVSLSESWYTWKNGRCESLHGRLRDELLNREIFHRLQEAKTPIENWRNEYNEVHPHGSLGRRPLAPRARTLVSALAGGGRLD